MMSNGITINGRFYELVEADNANECVGCAFLELCDATDLLKSDTLPCFYITQLGGDVIAIGHHFEEKSTK